MSSTTAVMIFFTLCVTFTSGCAPGNKWRRAKLVGGRHGCRYCVCSPARQWLCYQTQQPCKMNKPKVALACLKNINVVIKSCPNCSFTINGNRSRDCIKNGSETTNSLYDDISLPPYDRNLSPRASTNCPRENGRDVFQNAIVQSCLRLATSVFYVAPLSKTFKFKVRAYQNAYVYLTETPDVGGKYVKICFGCYTNTMLIIESSISSLYSDIEDTILDSRRFKGFWVRWRDDAVEVGHENENTPFHTLRNIINFPIEYVGVYTNISKTTWDVQGLVTFRYFGSMYYPLPLDRRFRFQVMGRGIAYIRFGFVYWENALSIMIDGRNNNQTIFEANNKQHHVPINNVLNNRFFKGFWVHFTGHAVHMGLEDEQFPFYTFQELSNYNVRWARVTTIDNNTFIKIPIASQFCGTDSSIFFDGY